MLGDLEGPGGVVKAGWAAGAAPGEPRTTKERNEAARERGRQAQQPAAACADAVGFEDDPANSGTGLDRDLYVGVTRSAENIQI